MTQRYIDLAFDDTSPRSFGGFNNENEATVIRLKVLDLDAKYYIEIEQACGKHDKYCSDVLPVDDGYAVFEVSRDFTHETLYVQGVMKVDGICRKTARVRVGFSHSINALDELPESQPSWADSIDKRLNELEQSSVIPDWNQNDEAARDYIKNRPGGYDTKQEIKIIDAVYTLTQSDDNQQVVKSFDFYNNGLNETYDNVILFDGNGENVLPRRWYDRYIISETGGTGYGNLNLLSSRYSDTGEKYFIAYAERALIICYKDNEMNYGEDVSVTVNVIKDVPVVFDNKYIPKASNQQYGGVKANVRQRNVGSETVNIDENGFLYTGQTLPTNGSNARYCVPIVSSIGSDDVLTYSLWPVLGALRPALANDNRHDGKLNTETHEALFILNKESTVGTYVLEITFKVGAVNKSVKSMKVNINWQGSKETSCAYFYCKALSWCSVLCVLFYKDTVTWEIIDNNIIEDFNAYLAVVDSVQLTCGNNASHFALTKIIKCVDKKR